MPATMPRARASAHPVFETDLAAGVAAVARAIGLRQARDLAFVFGEGADRVSAEGLLAHIFPAGDCASAILEISRLAEAAIDGLDMSPISDLTYDLDDRPIRESWSTPHDLLLVLADLSLGMHLPYDFEYTKDEKLGVRRLYAAIHLALCGPLPVGNWGARDHHEIVGCAECVAASRGTVTHMPSPLIQELAMAAREGEIDPAYTRRVYPEGWSFGMPSPPDDRPQAIRLTWHVPTRDLATRLGDDLTAKGFTVGVHDGWGLVIAQKPRTRGSIHDAMRWGSALYARYRDIGVEWYGAQTIFSLDRALID
jgi:hypothetical protein